MLIEKNNSPYTIIQEKLRSKAQKLASTLLKTEACEEIKATQNIALETAGLKPTLQAFSEEESLFMLLEVEKNIADLEDEIKSAEEDKKPHLKKGLEHFTVLKNGLCLARVNSQLSHQLRRNDEKEKSWNPHACTSEKVSAYGFEGTQRHRLAWFVNFQAPDELPTHEAALEA
jgi:hypothetical protein